MPKKQDQWHATAKHIFFVNGAKEVPISYNVFKLMLRCDSLARQHLIIQWQGVRRYFYLLIYSIPET